MKRVVVVGYAINGRGMGHLVRQLAILRQVRRLAAMLEVKAECWVLTTSEADTLARREGIPALKMPSKAMLRDAGIEPARYLAVARTWVMQTLAGLQPDVLVVDTFPAGSFGELTAALELARKRVLVARRVRPEFEADPTYQALRPLYDAEITPDARDTGPVLIREPAELMDRDAARAALGVHEGQRAVYLSLGGGGDPAARQVLPRAVTLLRRHGWHVVVGAGPLYDGPECRGDGITWLSRYVPVELLPGVDAAVSAGGYNSFHELMMAGVPTVFLPQPRIADDQAERVDRAVAAGAGRRAARLEDVPALLEDPGDPAAARAMVPDGGARAAARAVLSQVLDPADVAAADALLTPSLLALLRQAGGDDLASGIELLRILGSGPAAAARRRAAVQELRAAGVAVDDPGAPGPLVARFVTLCSTHGLALDTALALLRALRRKFPAATPADLVAGAEALFAAWAPFDDWMGAVSLLRAVPTQRTLTLPAFAAGMATWLSGEEDLFDALRDFSRLEGRGARSVEEVLRTLGEGGE